MLINISSHTHSTKHLQWLVSYSVSHHFLWAFHSTDLLWLLYLYSLLFFCQILQFCLCFIHFVFAHIFTSFSAFMYSLLTDDLCWLLIGYSLLDALFITWLFPCLVIRVSVFYIAICLDLCQESLSGCLSFS